MDRYLAAFGGRLPLVVVTVAQPWSGPVPDGVRVLDWSAVTTGVLPPTPGALPPDATLADAVAAVHDADQAVGTGAAFAFDRLGAVQRAWSDEAALALFLSTCPHLYRRRSLALWPVDLDAHGPAFLRRLTEITQVVVEIIGGTPAGTPSSPLTSASLTVRKADGRSAEVVGRNQLVEVSGGDLLPTGATQASGQRLGSLIRAQRLSLGLAQAEVARRVGISPSALSQVERGVRGPGGDTLVRLWEVLGVPFGPTPGTDAGYRIDRRSGREHLRLQEGLTGEQLLSDPATGQLWLLTVAPGARGDRAPFAVKDPESVTVLRGVLDLRLDGHTETLHAGDALVSTRTSVQGWHNPAGDPTELLWQVHAPMLPPEGPR